MGLSFAPSSTRLFCAPQLVSVSSATTTCAPRLSLPLGLRSRSTSDRVTLVSNYFGGSRLRSHRVAPSKASTARSVPRRSIVTMSATSTLYALDFDGVLCDSAGESSISAWKAAAELWPAVFNGVSEEKQHDVINNMRIVRPVVETGYENILLVRGLLEELTDTETVLEDWDTLRPEFMSKWNCDRADLVARFARTRDHWIETDLDGWLGLNSFYEGVVEAVQAALDDPTSLVYIVTTKDARFAAALLQKQAGLDISEDRIFSTTVSGVPKTEVLSQLASDVPAGTKMHFVEDKLSTLEKVVSSEGFSDWNLYLVDWGFNTKKQRDSAEKNERIDVITIDTFNTLMTQA